MNIRSAFEAVPTPVAVLGRDLVIQTCNKAYAHLAQTEEGELVGRSLFEIFPGANGQQRELLAASFERVVARGEPDRLVALPYSVCNGDENDLAVRFWSVDNIPLFDEAGTLQAILNCPAELTWRRSPDEVGNFVAVDGSVRPQDIQHALNTERERLRQLFQQAPGFICVLHGPDHVFELANDAYRRLVGQREIIGRPLSQVLPEVVIQGFLDKLDRVYTTGKPFIGRAVPIQLQRFSGGELEERFIDLIYQPMIDLHGKITGIFVQGNDVTEATELAREVGYQARHDSLTSLLNRRGFSQRTNAIDDRGAYALLYMDIDHFKIVNDRCSHAAGDSLLLHVAQTLKDECAADDVLARFGGDEFVLLRQNCSLDGAVQLANRLREAVKDINFVWQGRTYRVTLSVGVVTFGGKEDLQFDQAVGLADAACFLAKDKGRNRVQVGGLTDEEVNRQQKDMDGATRLQDAMREDRVVLYGQKIIALRPEEGDGRGFQEVLARIIDHDGSVIGPGAFIPAAERFGLIQQLDQHIVIKAFSYLHAIPPGERETKCLFINLSGITLSAPDFFVYVTSLLDTFPNVSPSQICFEVTETAAISDISRTADAMRRLIEKGFSFALDDFGSGMASFAYLHHLPAQFVKIDGEFVKAILTHPAGTVIVEAVVKVARAMNMRTIAEAVEHDELLPHLSALDLDYVQGYALHRPEPL